MLNKNNAIRVEKKERKTGGPRYVHIFKCEHQSCEKEIRVRTDSLGIHSGMCTTHSHTKAEFMSIYNSFKKDHRKLSNSITYHEFLEFTKIKTCHYCNISINWISYGVVEGKYISRAYYLDRKNNDLGYSKENCTVCCTKCNKAKSDVYTYEDWFGMTQYLRDKVKDLK